MKICDFSSIKVKNQVKMCLICSIILAYYVYTGITHMYDIIFMVSFITLIIRYFSIDD